MIGQNALHHAEKCRFCWMCRHLCPVQHQTGREVNTPRAKGLLLSMVSRSAQCQSACSCRGPNGSRTLRRKYHTYHGLWESHGRSRPCRCPCGENQALGQQYHSGPRHDPDAKHHANVGMGTGRRADRRLHSSGNVRRRSGADPSRLWKFSDGIHPLPKPHSNGHCSHGTVPSCATA